MYTRNYNMPNNMYRGNNSVDNYGTYTTDGERFFWAPFVVGGTYKLVHINRKVDMYAELYKFKAKNE